MFDTGLHHIFPCQLCCKSTELCLILPYIEFYRCHLRLIMTNTVFCRCSHPLCVNTHSAAFNIDKHCILSLQSAFNTGWPVFTTEYAVWRCMAMFDGVKWLAWYANLTWFRSWASMIIWNAWYTFPKPRLQLTPDISKSKFITNYW